MGLKSRVDLRESKWGVMRAWLQNSESKKFIGRLVKSAIIYIGLSKPNSFA